MLRRIVGKMHSEQGASMSMALLLFLICTVFSSAVLIAATASSGRIAELGAGDARYYNVTSAVGMFDSFIGSDRTVSYTSTQSKTGSPHVVLTKDDGTTVGYDFLEQLTCYVLYKGNSSVELANEHFGTSLYVPMDASLFDISALGDKYIAVSYIVSMQTNQNDTDYSGQKVKVEGRLYDDWTLDLVFSNVTASSDDEYSVYVRLRGIYSLRHGSDDSLSIADLTWTLLSVEPGRGSNNGQNAE